MLVSFENFTPELLAVANNWVSSFSNQGSDGPTAECFFPQRNQKQINEKTVATTVEILLPTQVRTAGLLIFGPNLKSERLWISTDNCRIQLTFRIQEFRWELDRQIGEKPCDPSQLFPLAIETRLRTKGSNRCIAGSIDENGKWILKLQVKNSTLTRRSSESGNE